MWSDVFRAEFAMKAPEIVIGLVHPIATLSPVPQPVALAAGEQLASAMQLRDPATAIHVIRVHGADEPSPLSAEPAGGPLDRDTLFDCLPVRSAQLDTVIQGDRVPSADELNRGRCAVALVPSHCSGTWPGHEAIPCQPHHIERSGAFNRSTALPVVTTARHGVLFA